MSSGPDVVTTRHPAGVIMISFWAPRVTISYAEARVTTHFVGVAVTTPSTEVRVEIHVMAVPMAIASRVASDALHL